MELVKPAYGQPIAKATFDRVISILENNLRVLHPFIPFISEEIWQDIDDRTPDQALIVGNWPNQSEVDQTLIKDFEFVKEVVSGIRSIRKDKNISFKETIRLQVLNADNFRTDLDPVITKLGNVESLEYITDKPDSALTFRVGANEYFVPVEGSVDVEAELTKLTEELQYTEGFLKSVQKKLSNQRFVDNAPPKVVEMERKKEADARARIDTIKASLERLQ